MKMLRFLSTLLFPAFISSYIFNIYTAICIYTVILAFLKKIENQIKKQQHLIRLKIGEH